MPGPNIETHPRQFLANHLEANGLYSKMIYVHTLINNQLRGDKPRKLSALEELWKAQDSAIFCLGSSSSPGFFHLPLRKAAYRSLLEAEKITREKRNFVPSLSVFDFDLDGEREYIFQDDKINCYINTKGACVFELDYLPGAWNYLDTLAPRGKKLAGNHRRCAFMDWLGPAKTELEDLGPNGVNGGRDCGTEEYEVSDVDHDRQKVIFRLPPRAGLPFGEIEILKTWQLKKNTLILEYVLKNSSENRHRLSFIPSIDFSFPGEGEEYLRINTQGEVSGTLNEALMIRNVKALEFQDKKNKTIINLEVSSSFSASIFNVYSGFPSKEEYQSTCIMPLFPVSLEKGKTMKITFTMNIDSL
jgi:hypothetical protein